MDSHSLRVSVPGDITQVSQSWVCSVKATDRQEQMAEDKPEHKARDRIEMFPAGPPQVEWKNWVERERS
jgi:hypothetical protein